MGMGMMGGGMPVEEEKVGALAQLMGQLPPWGKALVTILGVIALGAAAGWVVGRMIASVKYPDPEKHSVIDPKIKVAFLCVLAVCAFWLYRSMTKTEELPADSSAVGMEDNTVGGGGDTPAGRPMIGGAVAVMG